MERQELEPSPWELRWDLASARVMVWLARPSETRLLRPEVHLFLSDRYGRLARYHERLGHRKRAAELDRMAEEHFRLGGGVAPPPAVAMAMPLPRPRTVIEAVARPNPSHPDDAA